ncbi:flavin reductase family protein [Burkholderia sp. F1]|uniref:flavin reductase family protein n=1 Tax=Burkholderia sp. F1 TaxID=3366817 RepID=UPI003D744F3C
MNNALIGTFLQVMRRLTASVKFAVGDWRLTADGLPYLADAQSNLVCRVAPVFEHGTLADIDCRAHPISTNSSNNSIK